MGSEQSRIEYLDKRCPRCPRCPRCRCNNPRRRWAVHNLSMENRVLRERLSIAMAKLKEVEEKQSDLLLIS